MTPLAQQQRRPHAKMRHVWYGAGSAAATLTPRAACSAAGPPAARTWRGWQQAPRQPGRLALCPSCCCAARGCRHAAHSWCVVGKFLAGLQVVQQQRRGPAHLLQPLPRDHLPVQAVYRLWLEGRPAQARSPLQHPGTAALWTWAPSASYAIAHNARATVQGRASPFLCAACWWRPVACASRRECACAACLLTLWRQMGELQPVHLPALPHSESLKRPS